MLSLRWLHVSDLVRLRRLMQAPAERGVRLWCLTAAVVGLFRLPARIVLIAATLLTALSSIATAQSITNLTPDTAVAGGAAFTLFVEGSDFQSGAVVVWNGVSLSTEFFTSGSLAANVPASLVASIGTASITVTDPGGSASGAIPFTITATPAIPILTREQMYTPVSGGQPSYELEVFGSQFSPTVTVYWNGTPVPTSLGVGVLAAFPPASLVTSGPATLTAANPGGGMSNGLVFTVPALPTVSSLSPAIVPTDKSFTLTVNGNGFTQNENFSVSMWPVGTSSITPSTLTPIFIDSTQIQVAVPASAVPSAGTLGVWLWVNTEAGLFFSSNQLFLTVSATQTISFGQLNNESLGVPPFPISATASSGLTVTFASTTPSVCTVSGNTVTIVAAGTCSITASQAGNAAYAAATPVSQSFTVTQGVPATGGAVTYTYAGNRFTYGFDNTVTDWTPPTSADYLTVALTFSAPLPANWTNSLSPGLPPPGIQLLSWSATDQVNVLSSGSGNSAQLVYLQTDAAGNIANWTLYFFSASNCPLSVLCLWMGTQTIPDDEGDSSEVNSPTSNPDFATTPWFWYNKNPGSWSIAAQGLSAACAVALAPAAQLIPSTAFSGTIGVQTNPGCAWPADSESSFLAVTGGSSGTGPGTVQFSASANTGAAARAGALTIGGQTATINQSGTAPGFLLIPSSTTIQWTQGSPLPAPIPLSIYTQASSLPYTAAASVSLGSNWLSVSPSAGSAPATILVTVSPSSLTPGTFAGTITVTAPAATPSSRILSISLTVVAPGAPALSVTPGSLDYSFALGAQQPVEQVIDIGNTGSGTLSYSVATSTTSGGSWLAASPATGNATISTPGQLNVTVNPGSLSAGTYTGSVVISAPSQPPVTIPVTVTVSSTQQIISLAQTALTFTAVANGGTVPAQAFGIANGGSGVMNWSVSSSVTDTGDWLSVAPTSGSTDASSTSVPLVTVSVNPTNLAPGQYGGLIQVSSPSAANSPESVSVILNVLPAGSNPGAVVNPTGLIFTQALGGAAPGSQTVMVSNLTATSESFATQAETSDGGNWLVATPASGAVAPTKPATVTVSVNSAGLSAGVRQGILTLFFQDGSVQTVDVIYVLAAGGVTSARTGLAHAVPEATAATCTPTKLLPLLTSLGSQFTVPAAWPNTLQAQVVDDCGNPQLSGTVVVSFSNGDPPVPLISLKDGTWTGTWQVTNSSVSAISVTVNADNPSLSISGSVLVSGSLQNSATAPVINAGGVLNAASYAPSAPLAPGAMISIFGSNLANGTTPVNTFPLPNQLSGTLVLIGGELAPLLYAGSGQLNAIVPFGLPVNTNTQVIVQQGNAYTAPASITLAPANPAIFTVSGSGTGQGIIIRPDGNLAQPGTPAQDGDELLIYAAGLGATNPQATAADASTSTPLEYAAGTATLTIGGQNARVDFAGLAPGFAGLYQINAAVPSGVHGSTLPVILSVGGQLSPVVTMAVQ